jgi:hypothetical protein
MRNNNEIWSPHPGSQKHFLKCPAWEALYHGNRGGGKTDCLLMDFLQDVGTGLGSDWRGIIFRMSYTQLTDLIAKSKQWVPQMFPTAKYNGSEYTWTFEGGEQLLLRYIRVEDDYWKYHGHQYPFIGWEELTAWPTDGPYLKMMSCNRSSNKKIPRKYRATTNPSGPGHAWVKRRFIDRIPANKILEDDFGQTRAHVPSKLQENKTLLEADPMYLEKLKAMTIDNPNLHKAWVLGSWDLISGGALTDVWDLDTQLLPTFQIPRSWNVFRAFDWGSAKPWAVLYGAECNGEQPEGDNIPHIPKNSVVLIDELYGWNGMVDEGDRATSQEIAERVLTKDHALGIEYQCRVKNGPADTSIYDVRDGTSIGANMTTHGLHWTRAYKGSGSRIAGLAMIRQMLGAAKRGDLEKPHLYFFAPMTHTIRTLPLLQYDATKMEDVDTTQEDHCYDTLRYLLTRKLTTMKRKKVRI